MNDVFLKCPLNQGASTFINHNIGIRQEYKFSISDEEISFDGLNGIHFSFGFHFFTILYFQTKHTCDGYLGCRQFNKLLIAHIGCNIERTFEN